MKGILFIGGAGPARHLVADALAQADLVAAADAGLENALGVGAEPDLVVGDMDSLSDLALLGRFPADRVMRFPRDKDETDTEIGFRLLGERGCDEITIAGGGGGRIDHLLAVAGLFEREAPPRAWLTDREEIHLVQGAAFFSGWRGSTVSVFPLGEVASELSSRGLRWPLDGLRMRRGWAGISNVATADQVRITVGHGRLLVIRLFGGDGDA